MPSKTPAVSIVIPVYNADPTYLQQCLESVQAQDCNNVEVIVVDDGSTDTGTVRMCESFSNVFTVLHQSNQGVAAARNKWHCPCLRRMGRFSSMPMIGLPQHFSADLLNLGVEVMQI